MQKLFALPVVASFFFIFGIVLSQFGYGYLQRGSFSYTPQGGPSQIISPTNNPTLYWTVSAGILAMGVLCLLISAFAAFCLVRAYRPRISDVPKTAPWPPTSFQGWFGVFMFVLAVIGMALVVLWSLLHGHKI